MPLILVSAFFFINHHIDNDSSVINLFYRGGDLEMTKLMP